MLTAVPSAVTLEKGYRHFDNRKGTFSRTPGAIEGYVPIFYGDPSNKQYSSEFKVRVALEAIKGQKTANEIASEYGVHPTQIAQWKKQALDDLPNVFARPGSERAKSEEALIASLYQQIGQLKNLTQLC